MPLLEDDVGVPQALYDAIDQVLNREYTRGADTFVTELVSPVRLAVLRDRYKSRIVAKVSDQLHLLHALARHQILENAGRKAERPGHFYEHRMVTEFLGYTVSCRVDVLEPHDGGHSLDDWKNTSVWTARRLTQPSDGNVPDLDLQLNFNRVIAELNGFNITRVQGVLFLMDWRKGEARRNPDMPQRRVSVLKREMPPLSLVVTEMKQRIAKLMAARLLPDDELPVCTPVERWQDPDVYAVHKMTKAGTIAQRAMPGGLQTERGAAEALLEQIGGEKAGVIQIRPSVPRRCLEYCDVAPFCSFAKEWNASHSEDEEEAA